MANDLPPGGWYDLELYCNGDLSMAMDLRKWAMGHGWDLPAMAQYEYWQLLYTGFFAELLVEYETLKIKIQEYAATPIIWVDGPAATESGRTRMNGGPPPGCPSPLRSEVG